MWLGNLLEEVNLCFVNHRIDETPLPCATSHTPRLSSHSPNPLQRPACRARLPTLGSNVSYLHR